MEAIGEYLIGVTAAALLCALVGKLSVSGMSGAVIRMICGVFMAMAVVAPWATLRLDAPLELVTNVQSDAEAIVSQGENSAREAMAGIISGQVRTYILDKADAMGLDLEVSVELTDADLPVPVAVTLKGEISPYHKGVLGDAIRDDLGIGKEAQTWIS